VRAPGRRRQLVATVLFRVVRWLPCWQPQMDPGSGKPRINTESTRLAMCCLDRQRAGAADVCHGAASACEAERKVQFLGRPRESGVLLLVTSSVLDSNAALHHGATTLTGTRGEEGAGSRAAGPRSARSRGVTTIPANGSRFRRRLRGSWWPHVDADQRSAPGGSPGRAPPCVSVISAPPC
jgi:hypothetical protein